MTISKRLKLADSLTFLAETLGADNPLVQRILDGTISAGAGGRAAVLGSKLASSATRRELYQGGEAVLIKVRLTR